MKWHVHVKNELGHDDNIDVEANSELEAERAAAAGPRGGDVAVVMGAYPADPWHDVTAGQVEHAYIAAQQRIHAATADLRMARTQGRLDEAGAEYRAAEKEFVSARGALEDVFGPRVGLGAEDDDGEEWTFAGDSASPHNWVAEPQEDGWAR